MYEFRQKGTIIDQSQSRETRKPQRVGITLKQKTMGKGHGQPSSNPKGAGWPSTTGKPSGGGRGNNTKK